MASPPAAALLPPPERLDPFLEITTTTLSTASAQEATPGQLRGISTLDSTLRRMEAATLAAWEAMGLGTVLVSSEHERFLSSLLLMGKRRLRPHTTTARVIATLPATATSITSLPQWPGNR